MYAGSLTFIRNTNKVPRMTPTEVLTPEQVAAILQMPQHTVTDWCRKGHLRAFRPAGTRSWRITRTALDELMSAVAS
jgi:excisionase family DNA binding protein